MPPKQPPAGVYSPLRLAEADVLTLQTTTAKPYLVNDDDFQWDDAKAAWNFAKHGVSFEVAKAVFSDPFAIEQLDDRRDYGEERFTIIGMVDNRLLFVAFTLRDETVRIISARAAEPFEKREYHEQNT